MLSGRYDVPIETIWHPSEETIARANITRYLEWLARENRFTSKFIDQLARLRFTGIGDNLAVSYDNGATWSAPQKQACSRFAAAVCGSPSCKL